MSQKHSLHHTNIHKLAVALESRCFQHVIIFLTLISAVIFGIKTSTVLNKEWHPLLNGLDSGIAVFFVMELIAKIYALSPKRFFSNGWHLFDFIVIVVSIVLPLGSWSALRTLRVLRVFIMFESVPQLTVVIKSLHRAFPGIIHTLFLAIILFYVWALIGCSLFHEKAPSLFGDIGTALWYLFQVATLDGWKTDVVAKVMVYYPYAWIYFIVFIITMAFIILNLCIGVIVKAVSTISKSHTSKTDPILEEIKRLRYEIHKLHHEIGKK